jgi:hypothetical protein
MKNLKEKKNKKETFNVSIVKEVVTEKLMTEEEIKEKIEKINETIKRYTESVKRLEFEIASKEKELEQLQEAIKTITSWEA